MTCTRVDTDFGHMILCDFVHASKWFKVRGERIWMEFHSYLGPHFMKDGIEYCPEETDDELWDKFYRWLKRYEQRDR